MACFRGKSYVAPEVIEKLDLIPNPRPNQFIELFLLLRKNHNKFKLFTKWTDLKVIFIR